VAAWRERVPVFRRALAGISDLERDWERVPTTSRADLARAPWEFVPEDEPLDRMVIYRTAGTTGHPITVPHHPLAVRLYEPLLEHALERHGARAAFSPGEVACFLVGAQIRTYTYAAVLAAWNEAGFAKLNIRQTEWPREGSQARYFAALAPRLFTGDPISFAEMMRLDLPGDPMALVSTSVAMSPGLKRRLAARYRAPVIDWYSLVETGPIGYVCARSSELPCGGAPAAQPLGSSLGGHGYHVLPPDVHVEALRPDGTACGPGERGEIAITGGRNPFAPMLRYRTGDWGRLERSPCACGDAMPRILDLEGRVPVLFRAADGTPVSTVDLSRLLREHPLLLHEFVQRSDQSCELVCRPLPDAHVDLARVEADLRRALGAVRLEVRLDPALGDRVEGKVLAYRSELLLED
jgi:phenylacetate-CoA ligase